MLDDLSPSDGWHAGRAQIFFKPAAFELARYLASKFHDFCFSDDGRNTIHFSFPYGRAGVGGDRASKT